MLYDEPYLTPFHIVGCDIWDMPKDVINYYYYFMDVYYNCQCALRLYQRGIVFRVIVLYWIKSNLDSKVPISHKNLHNGKLNGINLNKLSRHGLIHD